MLTFERATELQCVLKPSTPTACPRSIVLSLMSSVGELSEAFQWRPDTQRGLTTFTPSEKRHVETRIADVILAALRLAELCDVSPSSCVSGRLEALARNTPHGHVLSQQPSSRMNQNHNNPTVCFEGGASLGECGTGSRPSLSIPPSTPPRSEQRLGAFHQPPNASPDPSTSTNTFFLGSPTRVDQPRQEKTRNSTADFVDMVDGINAPTGQMWTPEQFNALNLHYVVTIHGKEVELVPNGSRVAVTLGEKDKFVKLARQALAKRPHALSPLSNRGGATADAVVPPLSTEEFSGMLNSLEATELSDDELAEMLIPFTVPNLGGKHVELFLNGKNTYVTNANKRMYLRLAREKINELLAPQVNTPQKQIQRQSGGESAGGGGGARPGLVRSLSVQLPSRVWNPEHEAQRYSPSHFRVPMFSPYTTRTVFHNVRTHNPDQLAIPPPDPKNIRTMLHLESEFPTILASLKNVNQPGGETFTPESFASLELTFVVPYNKRIVELVTNGINVPVTLTNLNEYVTLAESKLKELQQ